MTTITAQLDPPQARTWGELEAVIDLASKAHDTASATARRTASAHAKAKLAGELRNEHGEWTRTGAADLVVHQDGSVAHRKTGDKLGSLSHEGGKWVAHHGDGTVSKHANRAAALREIASRHNKAGAPAVKTAPGTAPVKAAAPQAEAAEAVKSGTPVKPADLGVHDDGSVVSRKTGVEVGAIAGTPSGFDATHPDGTVTRHASIADAVKALAATAADAKPLRPGELSLGEKRHLIGMWSNAFRYSGESYMPGKEGEDFTRELHRLLSENKQPATCGQGCQGAHKFLGWVDRDAAVQHTALHRGIVLSTADAKRMFQPGKTMDMPAASWTTKPEWADSFADKTSEPGRTKVVIHTAPGAKGLSLSGTSLFGEGEVVTGGRYNVESVKTTGGVMNVYVTQQGFSAD